MTTRAVARRTLLSGVALAVAAAAAAAAHASEPAATIRVVGRLAVASSAAAPARGSMVVELRDEASGRIVAEQRWTLSGEPWPIAFALEVDSARVAPRRAHTVRGALFIGAEARWITAPVAADLRRSPLDLGLLALVEAGLPLPFASTLRCGERTFTIGFAGNSLRLRDGTRTVEARPVAATAGQRFAVEGDTSTYVWLFDDRAIVSVSGEVHLDCVAAR